MVNSISKLLAVICKNKRHWDSYTWIFKNLFLCFKVFFTGEGHA